MSEPAWPEHSQPGPIDGEAAAPRPGPPTEARYGFVRVVGAGGMGRVEAVFDAHLQREVARKTPPPGASPAVIARLEREARVAARLDHPGVVPVYDGGTDEGGRPWYTMRLVRGRTLAEAVASASDAAARQALLPRVLAACEAVAYAHSVGVVHRDLTPGNVLVGPFGETVVVDWGIARVLDEAEMPGDPIPSMSDPKLTIAGAVVGTPSWMSPEQARGEPADRRSDVYALGRLVRFVAGDRIAPDLDAIVAKACAVDPADRYPDAAALADDLEAWLAGRRVSAYAYAPRELLARLVRAWRVPLGVAGVAALALAVTAGVGWSRVVAQRDRAVAAESELTRLLARTTADLAVAALRDGDSARAAFHAADALALADVAEARGVAAAVLAGPRLERVGHLALAGCAQVALSPDGASAACATGDEVALVDLVDGSERWRVASPGRVGWSRAGGPLLVNHEGRVAGRALADGAVVAAVTVGPRAGLRGAPEGVDVAFADQIEAWLARFDGSVARVTCPAPQRALTLLSRGDRFAVVCDGGTLREGRGVEVEGDRDVGVARASSAAWLPDGRLLLGTLDAVVAVVGPDGVERFPGAGTGGLRVVAPSPDGRLVAVGGDFGAVRLLDLAAGAWVGSLPAEDAALAWRGEALVVATREAVDTYAITPSSPIVSAPAGVAAVAWSPDGARLALADGGGTVTVAAADGARLAHHRWQPGVLKDVVFGEQGLWAGGDVGTLRRIGPDGLFDPGLDQHARSIAPVPGGVLVGTWSTAAARVGDDGTVTPGPSGAVARVQAAAGRTLVIAEEPWLRLVEPEGSVRVVSDDDLGGLAALSGDGRRLAVVRDVALEVLDADTLVPVASMVLPEPPSALALDRDGDLVLTGYLDGTLRAHDARGERLAVRLHADRVSDVEVDPGDGFAATASWDRTVRRWDLSAARDPTGEVADRLTWRERAGRATLAP